MQNRLAGLREQVQNLSLEYRTACNAVKTERSEYIEAHNYLTYAEQAQGILQTIAQQIQQRVHDQIAGVVTRCLEVVFEEPYAFKIHFERKRGKTEARLVFERDGNEVDPMEGASGGVKDVASLALRLACLVLSQPRLRPLIVLDEPFKGLWRAIRPRVRDMVETLAEEMDFQFIIVTQIEDLEAGKVVLIK
jgi:DNA repair exonuclease SbcCD ATPase subunit